MQADRKMRIGLMNMNTGVHQASWLDPETQANAAGDIHHYIQMVQIAERGKLDLIFDTDSPGMATDNLDTQSRRGFRHTKFEPLTLLSVLATATSKIGLGATMSTTFNEPATIARMFASLDLISSGRSAWNVVTTATDYAARLYGLDKLPLHDDRYARAQEFVDIVKALWDTYEDDAFLLDRASGRYVDPKKFHVLEHNGKYFSIYGALSCMRSPQGHPVIAQAGLSNPGRELAAESGELIFTKAENLEKQKAYYDDVKGRMAKYGRHPGEMKILPGLSMVLADSKQEAEDMYRALDARVHPDIMRQVLGDDLEMDLSTFPLDEPIPVDQLPAKGNRHEAYFNHLSNLVRTEKPTLRALYYHWANRGRNTFMGTPTHAADLMEEFFTAGACDGFMVSFQTAPQQLSRFVDCVIPELQRRGLFRTDYEGTTLREHLGLQRPANRYAQDARRERIAL